MILMKYHALFVIFEKQQNLKLSSAANCRWRFIDKIIPQTEMLPLQGDLIIQDGQAAPDCSPEFCLSFKLLIIGINWKLAIPLVTHGLGFCNSYTIVSPPVRGDNPQA